eukprot:2407735-Ditylum_brightwellii.AAC.1
MGKEREKRNMVQPTKRKSVEVLLEDENQPDIQYSAFLARDAHDGMVEDMIKVDNEEETYFMVDEWK